MPIIQNQEPRNQNQNEIQEIVKTIKENNKTIDLEKFDPKCLKVAKPNSHKVPVNSISYQIFAPQIRMRTKMKINCFSSNFSLAMDISKSQKEILNEIENKIREETQKHDLELKKLNPKAKIIIENLKLVKESYSGPKMYGKIYVRNDISTVKFYRKEDNKKEEIKNPLDITSEFTGEVILDLTRIFLGEKESIICVVKCVLVDEIEQDSYFDELETVENSYE